MGNKTSAASALFVFATTYDFTRKILSLETIPTPTSIESVLFVKNEEKYYWTVLQLRQCILTRHLTWGNWREVVLFRFSAGGLNRSMVEIFLACVCALGHLNKCLFQRKEKDQWKI